jgi:glycopeptide antibiotics resistance protein
VVDGSTSIGAAWAVVPLLGAYLATVLICWVRGRPRLPRARLVTVTILVVYALSVAAATIFPISPHPPAYWSGEPWWTMIHWIPLDVDGPSSVLNVIMFVPFGVLVPLLWPRADSVRRLMIRAVCASATIELIQFLIGLTLGSRRTVDVNDLLANTAGALLGLLALRLAVPTPTARAGLATR